MARLETGVDPKLGFGGLEKEKYDLLLAIDHATSKRIAEGFSYSHEGKAIYFTCDEDDQRNFNTFAIAAELLVRANSKTAQEIEWQVWEVPYRARHTHDTVEEDYSLIKPRTAKFTPSEFLELFYSHYFEHVQSCLAEGRALKDKVRSAETAQEIQELSNAPLLEYGRDL